MQLASPVSTTDFAARLSALEIGDRFGVAVSGGRDSMALARLAADAAKSSGACVIALIVDHGLRARAAAETAQAKAWCETAGLGAHILSWRGAKPDSGVQAEARKARYFLLAEAANKYSLPAVLTAHNADDQAETLMMRLARGAGVNGLAAMEDEIKIAAGAGAPVRLVRPLLPFGRDALTATAEAFRQNFIDDPSNEDQRFERVRIRRILHALYAEEVLGREALLRTARRMGAARRQRIEGEKRAFAAMGGVFTRWGGVSFEINRLSEDRVRRDGVIAGAIRAVSGADYAPSESEAAAHLADALETGTAALCGALLKRKGDRLWLMREPAAILGRAGVAPMQSLEIPAGGRALWDNRFILTAEGEVCVSPLGEAGIAALGPSAGLMDAPREAILSLPGVFHRNSLIGAPGLLSGEGVRWSAAPLAQERFSGEIVRFSLE